MGGEGEAGGDLGGGGDESGDGEAGGKGPLLAMRTSAQFQNSSGQVVPQGTKSGEAYWLGVPGAVQVLPAAESTGGGGLDRLIDARRIIQ